MFRRTRVGFPVDNQDVQTESMSDQLLEKVLSRENMFLAWKRVKGNDGAAGVDGVSINEFPDFARDRMYTNVIFFSCDVRTAWRF